MKYYFRCTNQKNIDVTRRFENRFELVVKHVYGDFVL